jgi:hypothetical protein
LQVKVSRASIAGIAAAVAAVSLMTAATSVGLVSVRTFAITPRAAAQGKLWLLFSSALVADRPAWVELLAFAGFAIVVLALVGPWVLWSSALLGHAGSTLAMYGVVGGAGLIVPSAFASVLSYEDYGSSAMIAAWVGVIAAVAWRTRSGSADRLGVAVFVASAASIAWAIRPDFSVLDGEHVFAFAIGVAATHPGFGRYVDRVLREWWRLTRVAAAAAAALWRRPAHLFGDSEG